MKRELDKAMKKLESAVPNTFISMEYIRDKYSSGDMKEIYRAYIGRTDNTRGLFSTETKTPMEAVDDALVKFSQQLEESANARQTN